MDIVSVELTLLSHLVVLLASHRVMGITLGTMKSLQNLVCFVVSIMHLGTVSKPGSELSEVSIYHQPPGTEGQPGRAQE